MESKKRKPIIALLLSIITAGLGQVYNGQLKKGIIFYLADFLLIFAILGLQYKFFGMIALALIVIFWRLFIISDALLVAIEIKEINLRPYNKWFIYFLIVIFNTIASSFKNDVVKSGGLGVQAYKISSNAMKPSLLVGDHILVNLRYFKDNKPQRGDIIVFEYPLNPSKDFIKRCIGLPGDTLEIKNKAVFIDGKPLEESYVIFEESQPFPKGLRLSVRDNYGPIEIPPDSFFVMGDHRDRSMDSRLWGCLEFSYVKGKAMYIYWSKDKHRIGLEIR